MTAFRLISFRSLEVMDRASPTASLLSCAFFLSFLLSLERNLNFCIIVQFLAQSLCRSLLLLAMVFMALSLQMSARCKWSERSEELKGEDPRGMTGETGPERQSDHGRQEHHYGRSRAKDTRPEMCLDFECASKQTQFGWLFLIRTSSSISTITITATIATATSLRSLPALFFSYHFFWAALFLACKPYWMLHSLSFGALLISTACWTWSFRKSLFRFI